MSRAWFAQGQDGADPTALRRPITAKHRYAYVHDPAWRWRLAVEDGPRPKLLAGESRR